MKFTNKDGELRIVSGTTAASKGTMPYYVELLFTQGDFSFPIARPRHSENLTMDRGIADGNSRLTAGSDSDIFNPIPLRVSCLLDDTTRTEYLIELLSGPTNANHQIINNKTIVSTKGLSSGVTTSPGNTVATPSFGDTMKAAYNVEFILVKEARFGGSGTTEGWIFKEVHFPPNGQIITETINGVFLRINGLIYGAIGKLNGFTSGTTLQT